MESDGSAECIDEVARCGRVVEILHDYRQAGHGERDGGAEQHQQTERQHQRERQRQPVARDLRSSLRACANIRALLLCRQFRAVELAPRRGRSACPLPVLLLTGHLPCFRLFHDDDENVFERILLFVTNP